MEIIGYSVVVVVVMQNSAADFLRSSEAWAEIYNKNLRKNPFPTQKAVTPVT